MSQLCHAQKWISDENPCLEEIENCLRRIHVAGADVLAKRYLISVLAQRSGVSAEEIESSMSLASEEVKSPAGELDLSPLGSGETSAADCDRFPVSLDKIPGLVRGREMLNSASS